MICSYEEEGKVYQMKKNKLTTHERFLFRTINIILLVCHGWYFLKIDANSISILMPVILILLWNFKIIGAILYYGFMLFCMFGFSLILIALYMEPEGRSAVQYVIVIFLNISVLASVIDTIWLHVKRCRRTENSKK